MRPILLALILATAATATLAATPAASAHVCNGPASDCGNCVKGEEHVHNDGDANCVSDESSLVENNYGKRGIPAAPAALLFAVLAGAALVARRVRS